MIRQPKCWIVVLTVVVMTSSGWCSEYDAPTLPNPYPRELVVGPELHRWDFADSTDGWQAQNHCQLGAAGGTLRIHSTGIDPYLAAPVQLPPGGFIVRLRMRSALSGPAQLFWSSTAHPGTAAERVVTFRAQHDGQWHEYQVELDTGGDLTALRLDPGGSAGEAEVDWISIHRGGLHPLEIVGIHQQLSHVDVRVRNHGNTDIASVINGQPRALAATAEAVVRIDVPTELSLVPARIAIEAAGLPAIARTIWVYRPDAAIDHVTHQVGDLTIQVARDGHEVRLLRHAVPVAALAPLVHADHALPALQLKTDSWPLQFAGDGIRVTIDECSEGLLHIAIQSQQPVEGPIVRVFGELEQGLLAGVEYLGKGEHSSSMLDIETPEHLRVAPDPMQLTMPLMALVTDRSSVAMLWDDASLQPTFAVPDFLDGAPGHRMSLQGSRITAVLRVAEGWDDGGRLEPAILWAVQRRGLPALPAPPRSFDEQMRLSLAAYSGMVHDPQHGGWFHAVVPGVSRPGSRGAYLADCASAIWRITGQVPDTPTLAYGGSHVNNSAIYFVSGRAEQWLRTVNRQAEVLIRGQGPDGSYRYDGEYRRGHFEDTASGICSRPAYQLLEHAHHTANAQSLEAGLRTLQYMRRFRTPRGAQTWEVPLHTPDILASAQAVWACVRAFELTGDRSHLEEARRWAITGLPFVYQWSNRPIMMYATTPVLGATHWKAPNWIGLPVQWCGTVYAYALLLLAPHDSTLDWRHIAEGITICAEQMQYPDGPSIGTLPDVFVLQSQSRQPADINPGALVSLRLALSGKLDGLATATDGQHRVVAPFPVAVRDGQAVVQAVAGTKYQILIDGSRIVDVTSIGTDVVELAEVD
ncbi:MAG: hypothetical protein MUF48_15250 [Pirellulaceae bacterium]|nr:hypothetical protein [Pirellulaceae bacterium]